jgi:hypothetical protein
VDFSTFNRPDARHRKYFPFFSLGSGHPSAILTIWLLHYRNSPNLCLYVRRKYLTDFHIFRPEIPGRKRLKKILTVTIFAGKD